MTRSNEMLTAHFTIQIEVNNSTSWMYEQPRVDTSLNFNVPVEMLVVNKLSEVLNKEVEKLVKQYPIAVEEYRKEQEEKEAEKKEDAKVEA